MTAFQNKRFSVSQSGRSPEDCSHGWIVKGRCWYCGVPEPMPDPADVPSWSEIMERVHRNSLARMQVEIRERLENLFPSPPEPSE